MLSLWWGVSSSALASMPAAYFRYRVLHARAGSRQLPRHDSTRPRFVRLHAHAGFNGLAPGRLCHPVIKHLLAPLADRPSDPLGGRLLLQAKQHGDVAHNRMQESATTVPPAHRSSASTSSAAGCLSGRKLTHERPTHTRGSAPAIFVPTIPIVDHGRSADDTRLSPSPLETPIPDRPRTAPSRHISAGLLFTRPAATTAGKPSITNEACKCKII